MSFRSFETARREPAERMRPVVDPAGWRPDTLGDVAAIAYRFTTSDVTELKAAISHSRRTGVPIAEIERRHFPLRSLGEVMRDVRRELLDGRGLVMMKGFPVEELDREETAIGYIGLGTWLGQTMSQNKYGHVLGHVKDLGGDYADSHTRGYMTNAEMRFHADGCDYVGLLCLKTARSGGASRVASSVTVYNCMLARRPDLVEALCGDYYRSRSGEISAGEAPYFKQPIFSFTDGYFSATGAGAVIDKAQKLPGVPRWTPVQAEAVEVYRQVVNECAVDMSFVPGDIQLLNNFVTLHTRRAYEDWPEPSAKRHLLRLWLSDSEGRPIPKEQREGRSGRGLRIAGVTRIAPLEAETS